MINTLKLKLTLVSIFILLGVPAFMSAAFATADTLTLIQYPLINVPEIGRPGDTLKIRCILPQNASVTQLTLRYGQYNYDLPFRVTGVDLSTEQIFLEADLPDQIFYGLYDLILRCSDQDVNLDISGQSVYIIPEYKDDYTFIHVTDTHLPSHYFWGDTGVETDSTELEDFRAVIDDINIIHPEFVLHTGDLINDGELEYLGIPAISRAKKILYEIDVPLFLVAGNHDLGGWDYTPAPDGSARKTWWKYMGWNYLDDVTGTGTITQDFSFHYGSDFYVGLEAYQLYGSYDGWRENIYGSTSFTNGQLSWLQDQLHTNDQNGLEVLFYHKDFDNDLDLSALGVDAAFWGHVHYNNEDNTPPYDISTGSTCDGNRRYRIVKVVDGEIVFTQAVQAGNSGTNLTMISNQDSTLARITNTFNFPLENCLVIFKLEDGLKVTGFTNATLYKVDSLSHPKLVYALVNVPANSSIDATIQTDSIETNIFTEIPETAFLVNAYPNPFNPALTIDYQISQSGKVNFDIYDLQGNKVETLFYSQQDPGKYSLIWDATDQPSGVYFIIGEIEHSTGTTRSVKKCLLMK